MLGKTFSIFAHFQYFKSNIRLCNFRYDENCSGEVNYIDFAEKVMEADFTHQSNLDRMINSAFVLPSTDDELNDHNHACGSEGSTEESDSDDDEEGFEKFKRMEVQKLFNAIDKDGSQYIDRKEMEMLINALGKNIDEETMEEGFKRIDKDCNEKIEFEEFYEWFNSVDVDM